MPLISIITINFNNKAGLRRTISSVLDQSEKDIEYVIVDGGSDDGSVQVIEEYQSKISYWCCENDEGIYDAMNKGIARATGTYLLFLNSGDVFFNTETVKEMTKHLNNTDIVYGDLVTIDAKGNKSYHQSFEKADANNLLLSTIWHPCAFIKKKLFEKYGQYNTEFKLAGDYEFFIRVILKYKVTCKYIAKYICEFDAEGISNNPKSVEMMQNEREKAWRMNFSGLMIFFYKSRLRFYRSRIAKLIPL